MSKLKKLFVALALIAGAFAMTPKIASAQHWHGGHGGWHGGGWHGGGWHGGWRGGWGYRGWGWGPGFGWGWGYPRPFYGPYYYDAPAPTCGYVRTRVWRRHHWVIRRIWRCW